MKHPLLDYTGKKIGQVDLPDELFAAPINPIILAQYVRVYQARSRTAQAKTKRRQDLSASTAKIWRQKGTGRARHGSRRAPIFVGGAKAHGPTGNQNYQLKLTKRAKRQALASALSSKTQTIHIIKDPGPSAKNTQSTLKMLQATKSYLPGKRTTIVLADANSPLIRTSRNLPRVATTQAHRLNPYEILLSDYLLFTQDSLQVVTQTFQAKPSNSQKSSTNQTQ